MRIAVHDYAGHPFEVELSRELARRGHDVAHFYFAGDKGPKGNLQRASDDPASFEVVPVGINRDYVKSNLVMRAINDREYGQALAVAVLRHRPDIVISANTPLEAQRVLTPRIKAAGAKFVFWMQDFYSLAVERIISKKWMGAGAVIAAYYHRLEKSLLEASDAIVLISPDFAGPLARFKLRDPRIEVIPNWAPISELPLRPKANPWSEAAGLEGRFVFLYSGTLALKHNPRLLWALAESFSDRPDVVVAVAAHGVGLDELEAWQTATPLPNLRLFPLQPVEALPDMLACSDVVVALLEADAGQFSVPSKVLTYYCSGRPLLLAAPDSNLASKTTEAIGAGLVTPPDDVEAFKATAERLYADAELRAKAGAAGRAYAEDAFVISKVTHRFESLFDEIAAK